VERAVNDTALLMSHPHLLGSRGYMDQIILAIRKVNDHLSQVHALGREQVVGK